MPIFTQSRGEQKDDTAWVNPLHSINWTTAFWASDSAWSNPGDGVAVSTWRNAGDGRITAATQGTPASRPTYRASVAALNGQPGVEFDGGDSLTTGTFPGTIASPWSLVAIGLTTSVAADWETAISDGPAGQKGLGFRSAVTAKHHVWGATTLDSTVSSDTNAHFVVGVTGTGSTGKVIVDGGTTTTGITGTGSWTTASVVGLGFYSAGGLLNGSLAFAGLHPGDITLHPKYPEFKQWVASFYNLVIS